MDYLTEEQEDTEFFQLSVDMLSAEYFLCIHSAVVEVVDQQEDMELLQLSVDMMSAEQFLHIHIAVFEVVEEKEEVAAPLMQKLEVCCCMMNK